jgi:hypothetical protein
LFALHCTLLLLSFTLPVQSKSFVPSIARGLLVSLVSLSLRRSNGDAPAGGR